MESIISRVYGKHPLNEDVLKSLIKTVYSCWHRATLAKQEYLLGIISPHIQELFTSTRKWSLPLFEKMALSEHENMSETIVDEKFNLRRRDSQTAKSIPILKIYSAPDLLAHQLFFSLEIFGISNTVCGREHFYGLQILLF